ncbi:MAG: c-type cytochrome [Campylobacterota bacterium]|nr:c-type cytochrome [Campylobacterota bacterium]
MKKVLLAGLMVVGMSSVAFADGAAAYKKCAGCHGANGEKVALGKSKVIKDMSKADIVAAMKGYKDGTYGGPMKGLMKGQVASMSDADIQAIADMIGK